MTRIDVKRTDESMAEGYLAHKQRMREEMRQEMQRFLDQEALKNPRLKRLETKNKEVLVSLNHVTPPREIMRPVSPIMAQPMVPQPIMAQPIMPQPIMTQPIMPQTNPQYPPYGYMGSPHQMIWPSQLPYAPGLFIPPPIFSQPPEQQQQPLESYAQQLSNFNQFDRIERQLMEIQIKNEMNGESVPSINTQMPQEPVYRSTEMNDMKHSPAPVNNEDKQLQKKKYQLELEDQIRQKQMAKEREKQLIRQESAKKRQEAEEYFPFGKPGAGVSPTRIRQVAMPPPIAAPQAPSTLPSQTEPFTSNLQFAPPDFLATSNLLDSLSNHQPSPLTGQSQPNPASTTINPSFRRGQHAKDPWQSSEVAQKQKIQQEMQDFLNAQIELKKNEKLEEKKREALEEQKEQERIKKEQEKMKLEYGRELELARKKEEETRKENERQIALRQSKLNLAEKEAVQSKPERRKAKQVVDDPPPPVPQPAAQPFRSISPPIPTLRNRKQLDGQPLPTMAPPIRSESPPIPTLAAKTEQKSMIDTMQQQFPPLDLKPLQEINKMESVPSLPKQLSVKQLPTMDPLIKQASNPSSFIKQASNPPSLIKQSSIPPPLIKQPSIRALPIIRQASFHESSPSFDTKHILDQLSNIQKELKAEQEKVAEELNELQKPKTSHLPPSPPKRATPPKKVTPPLIKEWMLNIPEPTPPIDFFLPSQRSNIQKELLKDQLEDLTFTKKNPSMNVDAIIQKSGIKDLFEEDNLLIQKETLHAKSDFEDLNGQKVHSIRPSSHKKERTPSTDTFDLSALEALNQARLERLKRLQQNKDILHDLLNE